MKRSELLANAESLRALTNAELMLRANAALEAQVRELKTLVAEARDGLHDLRGTFADGMQPVRFPGWAKAWLVKSGAQTAPAGEGERL